MFPLGDADRTGSADGGDALPSSPALHAAETFDSCVAPHVPARLSLPLHLRKLRRAFSAVENAQDLRAPPLRGIIEPLRVAAGLYDVRADTAIDDGTIDYCGHAMAYENANSIVASRYLAATIMFNFAWMALEQAILIAAPPARGSSGARGRLAFAAMAHGDPGLDGALHVAWDAATRAGDMQADLVALTGLLGTASRPELAFELVRRVRNQFAHGNITPPVPLDWQEGKPTPPNPEVDRFFAATRVVLFLLVRLLGPSVRCLDVPPPYEDPVYDADEGQLKTVPADWLLSTAHLPGPAEADGPTLFGEFIGVPAGT